MNKIEWGDALKIGIEEIDNQHYELVTIYNHLCDTIEAGTDPAKTLTILKELGHYTSVHFSTEESVMRMLAYPEYEQHKVLHDKLIQELRTLTQSVEKSPQGVNFQLMFMIKQWLSKHILETDIKFVDHFLKFGIQPTLKQKSWFKKFNPFN